LVSLGYGGVFAPSLEHSGDDDDLSSFGPPDGTQLETQASDPLPLHPSKRKASRVKDAGFGSSREEQLVLERLSRGVSPPRGAAVGPGQYKSPTRHQKANEDDFPVAQDDDTDLDGHSPPPKVASKQSKRKSKEQLKRAPKGTILPDDSDDSEDDAPVRRKSTGTTSAHAAKRKNHLTDSDIDTLFDDPAPKLKKVRKERKAWTDVETLAVREGVKLLGIGKWSEIKQWAGERLQDRDNVAIKDKYRNMSRNNEISDSDSEWLC
jgi:hypothetical protein